MLYDEIFVSIDNLPEPLSNEETKELLIKAKNNDIESRNKLIEHNIKLVIYIVKKKFSYTEYSRKELVSIGINGIFKAIKNFDINKRINFSTYLTKAITTEILLYMRNDKINNKNIKSIYNPSKIDEDILLIDALSSNIDLENDYIDSEIYRYIDELVKSLPDKKRNVIELYYGFNNTDKMIQEEVGNKLNISKQYVNKILVESIEILKRKLISEGIIEIKSEKERKQASYKSIYEYFKDYSKEEIDYAISKLNNYYIELLKLKFWKDFNISDNKRLDKHENKLFYTGVVRKVKKLIKEKN